MIGVGVVGYGYWGPNLVRNFWAIPEADLRWVCDLQTERLGGLRQRFPSIGITEDFDDLLNDPKVDAVALATPVSTHFKLAMRALKAGKHVMVEKPIAATVEQAQRLVDEAERRGLVLAVDHTFLHTAAVRKMAELVVNIGEIYYYDAVRVNLGLFQQDTSVIWDLAVHDLSIMDHVLPERPIAISATGMSHVPGEPENIAYLTLFFSSTLIAHVHVNWLAPVKIRRTLLAGSKQMIVYDDIEPSEKIKVYDKGITLSPKGHGGEALNSMKVGYRTGDMRAPHLDLSEALDLELREFLNCIATAGRPTADGQAGLRMVRLLDAASRSLAQRGAIVQLEQERVFA